MMRRFTIWPLLCFFFLLNLLFFSSGYSQTIWSEFMAHYEGGDVEYGHGVAESPDGNFVIAGDIGFGPGGSDACLMKLDPGGTQLWTLAYGGNQGEDARALAVTRDGGLIFTGQTNSFGSGSTDVLVAKTDANGQPQWARAIGGTANDYGISIDTTRDGGYIIGGYTYSFGAGVADFYAIKLDALGTVQWTRVIGGTSNEFCFGVVQTDDDGYVLSGYTSTFGGGTTDYYAVKLNSNGTVAWTRAIGGSTGGDFGYRVMSAADSDIILSGYTTGLGAGGGDALLLKLDLAGNLVWARTYGTAALDRVFSVHGTYDNQLVCTGEGTTSTFGSGDQQVFKIDYAGALIWSRHYGTNVDETGFGTGMETSDNGILFTGWDDNDEDFLVTKLDSLGMLGCNSAPIVLNVGTPVVSVTSGGTNTTGGIITNVTLPVGSNPLTPVVYCSTVLPVEFISLSAKRMQHGVQLHWECVGNDLNSHYEIEKSLDGRHFYPIGQVSADWGVAKASYDFHDLAFEADEVGYRVSAWDLNGQVVRSDVFTLAEGIQASRLWISTLEGEKQGYELQNFTLGEPLNWSLYTAQGTVIGKGQMLTTDKEPHIRLKQPIQGICMLRVVQLDQVWTWKVRFVE